MESKKKNKLRTEIEHTINKVSAENESNTPDWILADYLIRCLDTFDLITRKRDHWYGVHLEPDNKYFEKEDITCYEKDLNNITIKRNMPSIYDKLSEKQEKTLKEWQEDIKKSFGEYGTYEFRHRPIGNFYSTKVYSDLTKKEIDLTE
jgi:hypothetical protein